jgi:hypothetical protein
VDGSSIVLRAVTYGDADLDGIVSIADLNTLRRHLGASGDLAVWQNGDFDYDGRVTARDYAVLRRNLGLALPAAALSVASASQALPEPAFCLAVPALGLMLRRRCRRRLA